MGNGFGKISGCFLGSKRGRHDIAVLISEPLDEGLGHSFCYIRPASSFDDYCHQEDPENVCSLKVLHPSGTNTALTQQPRMSSSKVHSDESKKNCGVPETTTFKTISGASVSANTATPLTAAPADQYNSFAYVSYDRAAAFESTNSFSAIPLQPVPRGLSNSGPLMGTGFLSGPLERGFLSGPLERGFLSGPLERGLGSGPLDRGYKSGPIESIERSLSSGPLGYPYFRRKLRRNSVSRVLRNVGGPLKKAITRTISKTALSVSRSHRSLVTPLKIPSPKSLGGNQWAGTDRSGDIYGINLISEPSLDDTASESMESQNLQWAQGKAGEDRVHVVISEEHGWLFVGIYDGFNGPDAPDYLLSNLYPSIHRELKGFIWDRASIEKPNREMDAPTQETVLSEKERKRGRELGEELPCCSCNDELGFIASAGSPAARSDKSGNDGIASNQSCQSCSNLMTDVSKGLEVDENLHARQQSQGPGRGNDRLDACICKESCYYQKEGDNHAKGEGDHKVTNKRKSKPPRSRIKGMSRKWKESQRKWKQNFGHERVDLQRRLEEDINKDPRANDPEGGLDHLEVLKALARALNKTEEAYLEMADKAVAENPELALMGSCVLVMLMKGEDVYVMNVGDSRAILAQKLMPDLSNPLSNACRDLERINEETSNDLEGFDDCSYDLIDMDQLRKRPTLGAVQLSLDHSTSVEEEVRRIKEEHLDDVLSITNDRVKGTLKVTRAFGAGFLKQPKWNNALLEVFRIDYVGTAPYITCTPALYHHRLGPRDHFLILSSDGLYQYFSNEEVVNHVEWFMASFPDGDPAQSLVEEVLFRAAKKAGMDFHELLDIPQGDRRKYHDDVSVMVVSLEGRIWRSSV